MKNEWGVLIMVVVCAIASIYFGVFAYYNIKELDGKPDAAGVTLDKDIPMNDKIKKEKILTVKYETEIATLTAKEQAAKDEIAKRVQEAESLKAEKTLFENAIKARQALTARGKTFQENVDKTTTTVNTTKNVTLTNIQDDIKKDAAALDKKHGEIEELKKNLPDVETKKTAFQVDQKEHGKFMNFENSELGKVKQELRDLTTREPIHANLVDRADGKVVLSDVERNFVSIDLGTGDGVKNGFRFEVYVMLPGNKHVTKAFIEVVNAGEKQSQCTVLRRPVALPIDPLSGYVASQPEEKYNPMAQSGKKGSSAEPMSGYKIVMSGQDINNPIVEGDLIQNPFYEAGRTLVFYIAGSKEMVGDRQKSAIHYRWTEIRDAAERYGAKVIPAVDTSLNYVIAQKNPQEDPEYKKAVDLGIPIVYEWELFRFLENN